MWNPSRKHGKPATRSKLRGLLRKKKNKAEEWEKAKREFDSTGGTPFNGIRAIAKSHNAAIAPLKHYTDHNMKCRHDSDTDSSALVADSGHDDSWDDDLDDTM